MSKLFIVPTPIGNLEDMSFRAIRILKEVDLILAEDTRTSGKLLKHFEISTHMHSHHMHNEHKTIENLIKRLQAGEKIALISDAGTPAISDPGFLLTRACIENNIEIKGINLVKFQIALNTKPYLYSAYPSIRPSYLFVILLFVSV